MSNKTSRVLTREHLMMFDPCYTYSTRFAERYPVQAEVTVELAVSQAEDWDWWFAAQNLLSEMGYIQWRNAQAKASEVYSRSIQPYRDLVDKAYDTAMADYRRVRAAEMDRGASWRDAENAGDKAYTDAMRVPRAAVDAVRAILEKDMREAEARAFAEIYIAEGPDVAPAEPEQETKPEVEILPSHTYWCEDCQMDHEEYDN